MTDFTTLSRTGLRFIIDTHIVDDPSPAVHRLLELAEQREIQVSRSDRMMVELREAPEEKRGDLVATAREASRWSASHRRASPCW